MKKRIKLEFFDRAGVKHTLAIEGDVTTDKINRLLEYAEIVAASMPTPALPAVPRESKMNRLLDVINTRLSDHDFDSKNVWQLYRENWGDDLSFGAISTYLSRLVDRGSLERHGSGSHWFYRLKPSQSPSQ
jgi:hypothetical protein